MGGIGGALFGTAETKSSYYCLCLLLRWQKYWNSASAFATSPPPHLFFSTQTRPLLSTQNTLFKNFHFYVPYFVYIFRTMSIGLYEKRYGTGPISYFAVWSGTPRPCLSCWPSFPPDLVLHTTSLISPYLLFFNLYTNNISIPIYISIYPSITSLLIHLWQRIVFIMGGTASTFPTFHHGYPTFLVSNTDCVDICHPSKAPFFFSYTFVFSIWT